MLRMTWFAGVLAITAAAHAQAPGPPGPPSVGVVTVAERPVLETSEFVGRI